MRCRGNTLRNPCCWSFVPNYYSLMDHCHKVYHHMPLPIHFSVLSALKERLEEFPAISTSQSEYTHTYIHPAHQHNPPTHTATQHSTPTHTATQHNTPTHTATQHNTPTQPPSTLMRTHKHSLRQQWLVLASFTFRMSMHLLLGVLIGCVYDRNDSLFLQILQPDWSDPTMVYVHLCSANTYIHTV